MAVSRLTRSLMLTLAVLGCTAVVPSLAAAVTVCASGCDATTIAGGIAAANPGDTVTVAAGTYDEPVISVNKSVTLLGANAGTPGDGVRAAESVVGQGGFYVTFPAVT